MVVAAIPTQSSSHLVLRMSQKCHMGCGGCSTLKCNMQGFGRAKVFLGGQKSRLWRKTHDRSLFPSENLGKGWVGTLCAKWQPEHSWKSLAPTLSSFLWKPARQPDVSYLPAAKNGPGSYWFYHYSLSTEVLLPEHWGLSPDIDPLAEGFLQAEKMKLGKAAHFKTL